MTTDLIVAVSEDDADDPYLEQLALQLRAELLQTDVESVVPATSGESPEGARSPLAVVAGALVASVTPDKIVGVVGAIVSWLRRNRGSKERKIHLEIDGDVIDLTGANDESEKRLVDAFLMRHAASPSTG